MLTVRIAIVLSAVFGFLVRPAAALTAEIDVDPSQQGVLVDNRMHGVFIEEINHGVDGGLYAELIANRAFEDSRPPEGCVEREDGGFFSGKGWDSGYRRPASGTIPRWTPILEAPAAGTVTLETNGGLNAQSPYCLRLDIENTETGRVGIANGGFWGIGIAKDGSYRLTLHARSDATNVVLVARLEAPDGHSCSDDLAFQVSTGRWQKFTGDLHVTETSGDARLAILARSAGTVWLDFVSLFPGTTFMDRPNGLRADLAQRIADLKPGFVRFPGGCIVEGGNTVTAYNWKDTIGPVESRYERWNAWGYRRTHGLGMFEYLQFCSDLGAMPLYVGFAGQSCLYRQSELVPMSNMGPVVQNFIDALAFANESETGRWGRVRTGMGRADPFRLSLVEIGNENADPDYEARYRLIHERLKSAHPDVRYIADYAIPDAAYDLVDEHYYNTPQWFLANFHLYDTRPRGGPGIYVGEYAVTGGSPAGCLYAALAEAVFAIGCERNGDVVRMMSYAPLLAHEQGRSGWHGIINFDGLTNYAYASYYAQKILADHRPDAIVAVTSRLQDATAPVLRGGAGVGTWHTQAEFSQFRVEAGGETLFDSRLAGPGSWRIADGTWSNRGVVLVQSGDEEPAEAFVKGVNAENMIVSAKARKIGGDEGFLISFATRDGLRTWWNIGGWGNKEHALEFEGAPLGERVPGHIETGRDYDIRVEVSGRRIRCFLDDQLVHDVTAPEPQGVYVNAGKTIANEVIVKAVNVTETAVPTRIRVAGRENGLKARWTVLTSGGLTDNNSLAEPNKVVPQMRRVESTNDVLLLDLPPRSLSGFVIEPGTAP